jgi:hypothetical protein
MIYGHVDAWPSLCWTWSMPFLYSGGYSLLIAVVQVISSTSGRCERWFVVLWMVVDVAVASRRLVWRHDADEHGAVRRTRWPLLMAVGLQARGVVWLYQAGPATGLAAVPAEWVTGCNHAAIAGLGAIWIPSVGSVPMASVLAMEMKSPWSRWEDPC